MTNLKDVLKIAGIFGAFGMVALMSSVAIQGNLIPTSDGNAFWKGRSQFEIRVGQGGNAVYTAMSNVSEEVREEVMGVVYDSPQAATDATAHTLPGNPAMAHANKICTHSTNGVKSLSTGTSYHLTWFLKHQNGMHYTRTVHRVYSYPNWVTTATYDYVASRHYCGC